MVQKILQRQIEELEDRAEQGSFWAKRQLIEKYGYDMDEDEFGHLAKREWKQKKLFIGHH